MRTAGVGSSQRRPAAAAAARRPRDPEAAYDDAKNKSLSCIADVMAKVKSSGVGGAAITLEDLQTTQRLYTQMMSLHPILGPTYTALTQGITPQAAQNANQTGSGGKTQQTQRKNGGGGKKRRVASSAALAEQAFEASRPPHTDYNVHHHQQPQQQHYPHAPASEWNASLSGAPPQSSSQPSAMTMATTTGSQQWQYPVSDPVPSFGGPMPFISAEQKENLWKREQLINDLVAQASSKNQAESGIAMAALRVLAQQETAEAQPAPQPYYDINTSMHPTPPALPAAAARSLNGYSLQSSMPPPSYGHKMPGYNVNADEMHAMEALQSFIHN